MARPFSTQPTSSEHLKRSYSRSNYQHLADDNQGVALAVLRYTSCHELWRFIHRFDSVYDDTPAERYQFPKQYLGRAQACLGDWIVYYEPRKVAATRGYFAVAKVERIIPDPAVGDMYLAMIEPGSYLDFASPVPFTDAGGTVIELGVLNETGRISGRAQAAVRGLSASDFSRIVQAGLADANPLLPRVDLAAAPMSVREEHTPFVFDEARERVATLVSRVVRDRVFRRIVLRA